MRQPPLSVLQQQGRAQQQQSQQQAYGLLQARVDSQFAFMSNALNVIAGAMGLPLPQLPQQGAQLPQLSQQVLPQQAPQFQQSSQIIRQPTPSTCAAWPGFGVASTPVFAGAAQPSMQLEDTPTMPSLGAATQVPIPQEDFDLEFDNVFEEDKKVSFLSFFLAVCQLYSLTTFVRNPGAGQGEPDYGVRPR